MYIYGKNVAKEAINNNQKINEIILANNFDDTEITNLIEKKQIKNSIKDRFYLDRLVDGHHQGIVLKVDDFKYTELKDLLNNEEQFFVILDHLEDPHNFGAIIRTCECAGVDYIIVPNKRNAEINATVMKTSAGALTNVKIVEVANLNNTMEKLKKLGYWIVGTDADGLDYNKIDYKQKIVLIIGSEGEGLKQIVRNSCDYIASLPLKGKVNSLNASVAAGIMIYEVVKAREN